MTCIKCEPCSVQKIGPKSQTLSLHWRLPGWHRSAQPELLMPITDLSMHTHIRVLHFLLTGYSTGTSCHSQSLICHAMWLVIWHSWFLYRCSYHLEQSPIQCPFLCNSLIIPVTSKITSLSVQFPHCLATHLGASDSLWPWRYTNLLTYLLNCVFYRV